LADAAPDRDRVGLPLALRDAARYTRADGRAGAGVLGERDGLVRSPSSADAAARCRSMTVAAPTASMTSGVQYTRTACAFRGRGARALAAAFERRRTMPRVPREQAARMGAAAPASIRNRARRAADKIGVR
jgi:hypothetical protein